MIENHIGGSKTVATSKMERFVIIDNGWKRSILDVAAVLDPALNHTSGNLYNELLSESSEEKCTAFQSMAWSLLFIKILLKTVQLFSKHFPSGLSLCIIYFLFHKGKDTSAIPQPSVHHLVYVFPICFPFYKCFNNFHLNKNLLTKKFFH